MTMLKVKRMNPSAVIPKYATSGSAGMDLTATSLNIEYFCNGNSEDACLKKLTFGTGLAFEIPKGHVGLLFPRSSIHKTSMVLSNAVGVIDSDFRGEVKIVFRCDNEDQPVYQVGDRVGQLLIIKLPGVEIEEVSELTDTKRGEGGFGSTGK